MKPGYVRVGRRCAACRKTEWFGYLPVADAMAPSPAIERQWEQAFVLQHRCPKRAKERQWKSR